METERVFLEFSADKLRQLNSRILACLEKLSEDQIWVRGGENENAVGNLCLHLAGNVRQWIGFGVAGREDRRQRDIEFSTRGGRSRAELKELLEATVTEAATQIEGVKLEELLRRTTVQKYNVTMLEAVYHVVEHFAQHTGQILYATKAFTGEDLGFYAHLCSQELKAINHR